MPARQYESAAQRLRALIEEADLAPGDKLPPERELAERLGVSRTSVRQALTVLRALGAVEPRQGDGVYLRRRMADADDEAAGALGGELHQHQPAAVMEAREGLEVELARLAARRRTPRHLAVMREALDAMAHAVSARRDAAPFDKAFHEQLAASADSPLLQQLIGQLAEPIRQTRLVSLCRPGRPERSLAGHRAILAAIERRDEDGAAQAMREHLMFVAFRLLLARPITRRRIVTRSAAEPASATSR